MQSLAGYGSGSDDEDERPAAPAAPAPVAGPSKLAAQAPAHLSAASPAPPAALNRIKGAASRGQSPLTGVRLPTSSSNSPRPPPSPAALGKRRDSSHSPPPFARAEPASAADLDERTPENGIAGVQLDTLAEFGIPPVPTGPSKASVEAKLANFHNLRLSRGLHFNDSLHASKAFRNPRIYAKLVEFLDVDETGSNWDREVWDSKDIGADAAASRIEDPIRSEIVRPALWLALIHRLHEQPRRSLIFLAWGR
ncbi:hypothetical protein Rhopal_002322-T1 [Rhodotorula paludigena]|uniref:HCNGP-domain-containing protein n=1 Tax=Rhodotorula paludigena TaxID=86838 RepID=A0AAV5GIT9_9BASI|nr:hypothetical protein Rhopal_002322-T1 [Rhodotorula paludigena]